jgi:hypothetical protein
LFFERALEEEEGLEAPTFLPVLVFRATGVLLADALAGDEAPAAAFGDGLAHIVLIFCDPLLQAIFDLRPQQVVFFLKFWVLVEF